MTLLAEASRPILHLLSLQLNLSQETTYVEYLCVTTGSFTSSKKILLLTKGTSHGKSSYSSPMVQILFVCTASVTVVTVGVETCLALVSSWTLFLGILSKLPWLAGRSSMSCCCRQLALGSTDVPSL